MKDGRNSTGVVELSHDETNVTGHAYTVMTKLAGAPLSEVGSDLDSATWQHLYRQIGSLLDAIHQIPQHAYGYLVTEVLEPLPTNRNYMEHQFGKKLREFTDVGGEAEVATQIDRAITERAALLTECPGPVLCHNDLHEGNVRVTRDGNHCNVEGLIDVENAIAADPCSTWPRPTTTRSAATPRSAPDSQMATGHPWPTTRNASGSTGSTTP